MSILSIPNQSTLDITDLQLKVIGEIDPTMCQCEHCRKFFETTIMTIHLSPTGKKHAFCPSCYESESDDDS